MGNKPQKAWRWIANILWGWGCANLIVVGIISWATWSSGVPSDWGVDMQIMGTSVVLLILPALTISLVLWAVASRKKKEAHNTPHEAPLYIYEHPLQE